MDGWRVGSGCLAPSLWALEAVGCSSSLPCASARSPSYGRGRLQAQLQIRKAIKGSLKSSPCNRGLKSAVV